MSSTNPWGPKLVGLTPGSMGDGWDGVDAGVAQGLDEVGIEGIEQGGIERGSPS